MRALVLLTFLLSAACGPAAGQCSTSTCAGCCDDTNTCRPGTEANACGTAAGTCTPCLLGQMCLPVSGGSRGGRCQ